MKNFTKYLTLSLMAALLICAAPAGAQKVIAKPKAKTGNAAATQHKSGAGNNKTAGKAVKKTPASYKLSYNEKTNELVYGNHRYRLVQVPGGTFTMGATEEQGEDVKKSEKPPHEVTLPSFRIGATEVPQWLWVAVMGENPSIWVCDMVPVNCVNWVQCMEFIERLNALTGREFSLPTEAEWEYAARGGRSGGTMYAGSDNIDDVAWYHDNSNPRTTGNVYKDRWRRPQKVGTKHPNSLGLYDMSGNVSEWCADWYAEDYYENSPQNDPQGPLEGHDHVLRGGSYGSGDWSYAPECRVSYRSYNSPHTRFDPFGLRLVEEDRTTIERRRAEKENRAAAERRRRGEDEQFIEELSNALSYDEATGELRCLDYCYKLVSVPRGSFTMGKTREQGSDWAIFKEEKVRPHNVSLSAYRIGATEVPQWLWIAVMGSNPSNFKDVSLPVENVSWDDCIEFISRLNAKTGKDFRLPTEAEWEYAARGGRSGGTMYSGSNNLDEVAWYRENSGEKTHEVGTKLPNSLGLYDMSGNVSEWCADWLQIDYYRESPSSDPQGPSSGSTRVCRGGGYVMSCGVSVGSISCRNGNRPDSRSSQIGLRLAM